MNDWSGTLWLLAQQANWVRMGDAFSGENAELSVYDVLGVVGFFAVVVLLVSYLYAVVQRRERGVPYNRPKRLFRELCRAHHLKRSDEKLLRQLAHEWQLNQPAELFVRPDCFCIGDSPDELIDETGRIAPLGRELFARDR